MESDPESQNQQPETGVLVLTGVVGPWMFLLVKGHKSFELHSEAGYSQLIWLVLESRFYAE